MPDTQHDPEITVHHRCRIAREHAKLDQDELAARLEIARTTVVNYERGHIRHPKSYILKAWAETCGVSFDWLQTGRPRTRPCEAGREWVAA